MKKFRLLSLVTFVFSGLASQAPVGWQLPPEPIAQLVTAVPAPTTELSPCRRFLLLIEREAPAGDRGIGAALQENGGFAH